MGKTPRHCEEQRDEAVQARRSVPRDWIATPAKRPARDDEVAPHDGCA